MKKILLVMTGGTIGSYCNNGIISAQKGNCRAVELYRNKYNTNIEFTEVQLLNILSENLEKSHWETLVNFLYSANISGFDGIIITHGSDTLSYSSAMLGICLRHFNIPIIITASNYIPDDKRSNAVDNIHSAVILINTFKFGVFTVYKNDHDDFCSVYIPTQIKEADRLLGKFTSFDGTIFGKVTENTFEKISEIEYPIKKQPAFENDKLVLKNDVLMIKPYPSMLYSAISIPKSVKAVLHVTYHSSTVKINGNENALAFLKSCRDNNVDFYITSVRNCSIYETNNTLIKNGAIPIYNMSNETAFVKLLLLYNLNINDKHTFLEVNI